MGERCGSSRKEQKEATATLRKAFKKFKQFSSTLPLRTLFGASPHHGVLVWLLEVTGIRNQKRL
jgi:hypothetical protein